VIFSLGASCGCWANNNLVTRDAVPLFVRLSLVLKMKSGVRVPDLGIPPGSQILIEPGKLFINDMWSPLI
jgi:hypothetical protein